MFCSTCGKEIHDKAMICPNCGCATANFSAYENKDTISVDTTSFQVSDFAKAVNTAYSFAMVGMGLCLFGIGLVFAIISRILIIKQKNVELEPKGAFDIKVYQRAKLNLKKAELFVSLTITVSLGIIALSIISAFL